MAATDVSPPPALPPAPRPARRRRLRLLLAALFVLAVGVLACEGWAAWQQRAARQALAAERFDDARRHIDRVLMVHPRSAPAHLLAARIDRLRGAYSEAEGHLGRCAELGGMSEPLQVEWMLLRCQRAGLDDRREVDELAPGLLAAVERKHPESAAILEALADVYMRQTRYLEALRCLDRWVELAPDSVRARDWRGWVGNQLDHRDQAIPDYERALELQPGRSAVRLRLAEVLLDSARAAEARPHLERLRQEMPDDPALLVALARCRMALNRPDEARTLLDSVLQAHPHHFEALLRRGELEKDTRHFAEAERWLLRALEEKPLHPEARYALMLSLRSQGKLREAEEQRVRMERDKKQRDRLVRLVRTELDRRPNSADLAAEAGELFLQQGETRPGLYWLNRALVLNPRQARALRALVAYHERAGDKDRAEEYRRRLAEIPAGK